MPPAKERHAPKPEDARGEDLRDLDLSQLDDRALFTLFRALPKTDLHCHLDGSMRVATVAELARERDVRAIAKELGASLPPEGDSESLKALLCPGTDCKSLVEYLRAFAYTCAVLQTPEALERVAYELGCDAAAENCRYLEVRFAPMLHLNRLQDGMAVLRAVDKGLERAEKEHQGRLHTGIIVCAMRNFHEDLGAYYRAVRAAFPSARPRELAPVVSLEVARLTVHAARAGVTRVLGFDLAGPEENYPPRHHTAAFDEIIKGLLNITVHAGEAYGPLSIQEAVTYLNAHRIGHGTRILEEGAALMEYFRDHRIAVEVCLTSNLQTKAVKSLAEHPFRKLVDAEVRVCICTDNRLISDTDGTRELFLAYKTFGLTSEEIRRILLYGFKSAFCPYEARRRILLEAKEELHHLGLGWGAYT